MNLEFQALNSGVRSRVNSILVVALTCSRRCLFLVKIRHSEIIDFLQFILLNFPNSIKVIFFVVVKFCIGVYPTDNVVIVSGAEQRDSATHVPVSILPQTPLPSRLPHNIEQSSLCYAVCPCWFYILNIAVCTCPSQTP